MGLMSDCPRCDSLSSEMELLRQVAADANAQLNAMRAERDSYKAWHDATMRSKTVRRFHIAHDHPESLVDLIVRPQPLKENE